MIVRIDRADDPRLEHYRHVADHRRLRAHDLFVAEGRLVVERLIGAQSYAIHSVLVSPAAHAALEEGLCAIHAPVYVAPQPLLNEIAGFNFHRGCLALARRRPLRPLASVRGSRLLLGLERIGNPDNVGGLFRTAAAFGVDAVVLDDASGDPLYRKAIRTSMGAVLQMPYVVVGSWGDALGALRSAGYAVAALTPHLPAMPLDAFAAQERNRLIVLVGAEGGGLSGEVLAAADARVRVPMAGAVDSLNVVVAAGIALSWLVEAWGTGA